MNPFEARAVRGERSGLLVCHTCSLNKEGYCIRFSKWCNLVRYICERDNKAKIKDGTGEIIEVAKEKPGDTWKRIYGTNYYNNKIKETSENSMDT